MEIRTAGEALYIASEMERRAIRLYERALMVFGEASCQETIANILREEQAHLATFQALGAQEPDFEHAQLLSARASDVLFSGGLMEAQRKGAFESPRSLYTYAANEEAEAIRRYGEFAARFNGSAAAAFDAIVQEEKAHFSYFTALAALQEK